MGEACAFVSLFFFIGTASTEFYTLSLHDALPISAAHPRGGGDDVHRARSALRELHPPAHDPLDAALGGRGGAPCAYAHEERPRHHRRDRHHPPDRHRQEERHHDDRLRARCREEGRHEPARCDLSRVPVEVPPDPDDDAVGAARRAAPRARLRRGLGAAPSARHHHGGRPDPLAGAHALYHPGNLSVVRSPGAARERAGRGGRKRKTRRERTAVNLPEPSIRRPVATTLLTVGVTLAGAAAFGLLPVAPLPQVDYPTISVRAQLPGASPEVIAPTVAMPLER